MSFFFSYIYLVLLLKSTYLAMAVRLQLPSWTWTFLDMDLLGHGPSWTWTFLDMDLLGHGPSWTWCLSFYWTLAYWWISQQGFLVSFSLAGSLVSTAGLRPTSHPSVQQHPRYPDWMENLCQLLQILSQSAGGFSRRFLLTSFFTDCIVMEDYLVGRRRGLALRHGWVQCS